MMRKKSTNLKNKKRFKALKLTVELILPASWSNNLKNTIEKEKWDEIRKNTYVKYNHKCGICGADAKLNCHEIWEYDNNKHVQRLGGLIALCGMCHWVKHIGLAEKFAERGALDYDKVVKHFMRVNNCDKKAFDNHMKMVDKEYKKRSMYKWIVDFGEYEKYRSIPLDEVKNKISVKVKNEIKTQRASLKQKNKKWLETTGLPGVPESAIQRLYEIFGGSRDLSKIEIKSERQITPKEQYSVEWRGFKTADGKYFFVKELRSRTGR